ncbi:hypothetical protein IEQ34_004644 [Dendrobium chrysotoxum]|uniref:Uncharacterized protein n=1 Tax=Dendrobium chrysotoxum TaxID=161865 RepID=A0AAV7HFS1_DENCH|nr:hypothetical protein IEQ34_004644 [Dendrobium chrysotoxum]
MLLRMPLMKSKSNRPEKVLSVVEQQQKINEVRKLIAPLSDDLPSFCCVASTSRFLIAGNLKSENSSLSLENPPWRELSAGLPSLPKKRFENPRLKL